jgi:hypothetical protein
MLFLGSHRLGDTQSAVVPQLRKQSLVAGLHRKAPQEDIVPPLLQVPLPSQVLAAVTVDVPVGQEAATHCVPAGYFWQAPAPSHFPLLPQLAAPVSTQRASAVLADTGLHIPTIPGSAHETQAPLQALLQQTPWAQVSPVWHSPLLEQLPPGGFKPQEPLVQTWPVEQSASAVQVALQAATPHLKGTHDVAAGVTQVPAPSQTARPVKVVVLGGQVGSLHDVPLAYFWQPPASHLPLLPQLAAP